MSILKSKSLGKSILVFSMFVALLTSCKKDEEINPDYVGTWSATETVSENGITMQIKDIMTFTKTEFSDLGQMYNSSTKKYIDYTRLNGKISASGDNLNFTVTEIGMSSIDNSMLSTGNIVMYKDGNPLFNTLFDLMGKSKTFKSSYSISGNKMTLKIDDNNDGDYLDAGETTVYTKQ